MIWRHRKNFGHTKGWYNSKKRYEFCRFFLWFLDPNCPNTSRPKLVNTLDQNVLIQLVSIIYNGNIQKFWHRKLRRRTWYSSKSLWAFSCMIFDAPNLPIRVFFIIRKIFIRKWVSHASQASPASHVWFGIFITTDFSWSSLKVTKMSKF